MRWLIELLLRRLRTLPQEQTWTWCREGCGAVSLNLIQVQNHRNPGCERHDAYQQEYQAIREEFRGREFGSDEQLDCLPLEGTHSVDGKGRFCIWPLVF